MSTEETVLADLYDLYRWDGPKAKLWLTGTVKGAMLLTTDRLIFLSTGTSGLTKQLAVGLFLGPIGALTLGKTKTSDLDLSALGTEGSLELPIGQITEISRQKRWDFASYIRLRWTADGAEHAAALMTKTGFNAAALDDFIADVDARRRQ